MNGLPKTVPYCTDYYNVYHSGNFIRFQTTFGLAVEYDGSSTVNVYIPQTYRNGMTGICGNFDGNAGNDLTMCNGHTYSGSPPEKFGDVCVVNDTDSDRAS